MYCTSAALCVENLTVFDSFFFRKMSSVIRNSEAIPPRFMSCGGLDLTMKFLPSYGVFVTYGDLTNVMYANGISTEEVKRIYKVSASDSTLSVLFKEKATVDHLSRLGKISTPRFKFDLVHMSQQIIKFHVHWLPLYYDDTLLKGIFFFVIMARYWT